ncbi:MULTISPECIES: hypothetical protein [unclassified Sphingobacterium]|uniref:hypothetical protein n=1 Tax=unclassified Sphingobacterium TaxID=2609468 RepID=UPI00038A1634|nr:MULTISPECIES: hypothetical protein [unclassified Sphingobacterium]KKX48788.1 hypothetical protein L950_0219050 [Sphingobacterium sp. IITKGP-BTPF85]QQD14311.1 hypothetical protein JAZ75_01825 [Sphingobacterium sp. UDSM-2020]
MTIKILLFLLMIGSHASAQELNLLKIRKEYSLAVKDESICENNLNLLRAKAKETTDRGYLAVYEMVFAKHMGNPFRKLGQFNKGKNLLETLIKEEPSNVELRFIRWSVQTHAPSILNYSNDIKKDKSYIIDHLYTLQHRDVKEIIYKYIKGANSFSEDELKELMK